jgi:hypothetical protein
MRMIDRLVIDDDLGLGSTAARFWSIGLGLYGFFSFIDSSFGENDGSGDDTLSAGAGESKLFHHLVASCSGG